jgi:hypothetical protein
MLISELTVYDFLKDQIKLSDSDAKRYAKEIALVGEGLNSEIKDQIHTKFKESDYVTKSYLDTRISQLETRIEKGFREIIIWVIGFTIGIVGIAVAIIKLF